MIVVTGASRGLGQAIASRLAGQGKSVLGLARSGASNEYPIEHCSVSDYPGLKAVAASLRKQSAEIDAVINAAGIASMNLAVTTPEQVTRNVIETNLLGTIFCCQLFSPLMIRRKQGRIINFSTIAVPLSLKGESVYVASKAGVEHFSRAFAREMADFNITVNCIAPGPIDTALIKGVPSEKIDAIVAQQFIRKKHTPDDICDLVDLLLDDKSASLTGQILNVGGA